MLLTENLIDGTFHGQDIIQTGHLPIEYFIDLKFSNVKLKKFKLPCHPDSGNYPHFYQSLKSLQS